MYKLAASFTTALDHVLSLDGDTRMWAWAWFLQRYDWLLDAIENDDAPLDEIYSPDVDVRRRWAMSCLIGDK
ncbi:hypothetical protein SEA_SCOTTISH_102 [Mycobacterium phage Scottish]|uniref:Uncharacterized protein n=2 Tax=Cheoctovirus TaxID=1623281 RepID=A0A6G6XRN6_9CAUD|nr:hypothetical protein I5H17_gp112 [Mycobacterium phage BodEinwohner17]YP_009956770.1 hypothetical protein I5H34_gp102 [Mycobacterium phage Empress]QEQ94498.1 hypothetical protein SEA_KINGMIDAS_102 [Mycobacterium phage KingMidas]QHB47563.1 hypothetical protein SEA_SCOTTISH_102 [Mycobacterium phage Scottish]WNM68475.1 hypothetical protein SEA_STARCEVICH_104 [Mycobacterium phage Starcevich]WNM74660.1 hypothetical protein SEA_RADIANCE_100 [Mycobacterium Phage Radiance]WNT44551.1 hypothetical pr